MQQKASALTTLRILYFAMLIGMALTAGVIWFVSQEVADVVDEELHEIFLVAVVVVAIACIWLSKFLFSKDLAAIQQMNDLKTKMDLYRTATIKRFALTEAPFFFAVIVYFITQQDNFLIIAAIMFMLFVTLYPSSTKIGLHINETPQDIEQL